MFENLVESTTQRAEKGRRSAFTIGTFSIWVLVFTGVVVWQIWAFAADLNQVAEQTTMLAPPPPPPPPPPATGPSNPTPSKQAAQIVIDQPPVKVPETIKEAPKAISLRTNPRETGDRTIGTIGGQPGGVEGGTPGGKLDGIIGGTDNGEPPPPPPPVRQDPPVQSGPIRRSEGVLRGNALNKLTPAYPPIAKQTGVSGDVTVEILIDENGRVVSARALGGPALLQQAAVSAARGWSFRPTLLNGQAVKVTGAITFRFSLGN